MPLRVFLHIENRSRVSFAISIRRVRDVWRARSMDHDFAVDRAWTRREIKIVLLRLRVCLIFIGIRLNSNSTLSCVNLEQKSLCENCTLEGRRECWEFWYSVLQRLRQRQFQSIFSLSYPFKARIGQILSNVMARNANMISPSNFMSGINTEESPSGHPSCRGCFGTWRRWTSYGTLLGNSMPALRRDWFYADDGH